MKTLFVIVAALAAVTFPVYFVIFIFKSLLLGIVAALVSVMWVFGQLFIRLNIIGKKEKSSNPRLIGR